MKNCIFCEIIKGNIPSKVLYEDNLLSIIMNINYPQRTLWKYYGY